MEKVCQRKKTQLPFGKFSSAVEFWRIKHSEWPPSHQGLRGRSSYFLHPKFWGRTARYHKKVDFDVDARKILEGTLGGCREDLTPQPRKSGLFMALFSYAATPNPCRFFVLFSAAGAALTMRRLGLYQVCSPGQRKLNQRHDGKCQNQRCHRI